MVANKQPKLFLITSKHSVFDSRIHGCFFKSLQRRGFDVHVVGPGLQDQEAPRQKNIICLPIPCSSNQSTLASVKNVKDRLVVLAMLLRRCLSSRPDIIQACDPDSFVVGWLAARLTGGKAVFDVHEMFPAYIANRFPARMREIVEKLSMKIFHSFFNQADAIFHVSQERLNYYGCRAGNQFIVPSFPAISIQNEISGDCANKEYDLVHLGKIGDIACRREILQTLCRCQEANKPVSLMIVGQSRADFQNGMEEIDWGGIKHLVSFVGPVPHEQALELAAKARLGLAVYDSKVSSRSIVASRKAYEYMALGLPIIANNVRGLEELIGNGGPGRLVALEAPQLAAAILELLYDPAKLRSLSLLASQLFADKYNWEVNLDAVIGCYDQILSAKSK